MILALPQHNLRPGTNYSGLLLRRLSVKTFSILARSRQYARLIAWLVRVCADLRRAHGYRLVSALAIHTSVLHQQIAIWLVHGRKAAFAYEWRILKNSNLKPLLILRRKRFAFHCKSIQQSLRLHLIAPALLRQITISFSFSTKQFLGEFSV